MAQRWQITIDNFLGGFAPGWWKSDYPSYGNRNQAGDMLNVDLTNPSYITQGPGLVNLINGTEAGVVTTLIRGILDKAQTSDVSFAIGGTKLYKISSTEVISDANFPHTITGATNGEDVAYFQGKIYYTWDTNVGQLTLPSTFDDDWGSTVPTGATALQSGVPHPMEVGGNDFLYIGNKNYVTSYDGTTFTEKDLDLPDNAVIQDLKWTSNRLWIAANQPDLTGSNNVIGSIYVWDGNSPSWEDEIRISGRIGGMFVKEGILYVFYQDLSDSIGGYKLGYFNGTQISELAHFKGGLPAYYQIAEYKNFIIWVGGELIYAWGAAERNLPAMIFQLADGGYSTVGGLACPFGTPLVASNQSTSYRLAKFSGYDTNCYWKSLLFDISGTDRKGMIDELIVNIEKPSTGARVDITLKNNQGTSLWTDSISYAIDGAIARKIFYPKCEAENCRLEFSWANGSATNPLSIKNVIILGHTLQ